MQQIFPDEATRSSSKPLINFEIPTLDHGDSRLSGSTRKRSRSSPQREANADAKAASETRTPFMKQEDCAALQRFLEYGDQPSSAVEFFHSLLNQQSTSDHQDAFLAALPSRYRWCGVALQQALSVLCGVVRLDTSAAYLQPRSAAQASTSAAGGAATSRAAGESDIRTLELYCRYQALELELEDAVLRAQSAAHADGVPESVRQQASADVDAAARCIEQSINALESTLVDMLLPMGCAVRKDGDGSSSNAATAEAPVAAASARPSLEYVAMMVRGLHEVLASEKWPANFVCSRLTDADSAETNNDACHTVLQQHQPAIQDIAAALLGTTDDGDNSTTLKAAAPASVTRRFRAQVGAATTSLALRSLFDVAAEDVWNLFGVASSSPISRLAALEKLKGNSSQRTALNNVEDVSRAPPRSAVDVTTLEFKDVLIRAWNHGYALLGLRRLRFEMQALFYQYTMRLSGQQASIVDICHLWRQWNAALQAHFKTFMQQLSPADATVVHEADSLVFELRGCTDACSLMRQHAQPADALSPVQSSALRVLAKLQTVDSKGWFAIPAFDLVNVDFTSMRYWIASPSFAHKSKREAYRSLCRVLERMVDCCVQKYGPTHAFSDVITNVRQQLVEVARTEGLL